MLCSDFMGSMFPLYTFRSIWPFFFFCLTLSHPIALRVEYLRGPIDFRIAQHVWDDQIHLQNTHWKQAQNAKLIMQNLFNSISPYILYVLFPI